MYLTSFCRKVPRFGCSYMKRCSHFFLYYSSFKGGTLMERKFAIRCIGATWCLACFVFVQSYSCVLTSVLTMPATPQPIINSIYDIPKVKGLKLVVLRGLAPDLVISVYFSSTSSHKILRYLLPRYLRNSFLQNAQDGVVKYLGGLLNSDPDLRCNSTEQCMDRVLSGPNVFIYVILVIIITLILLLKSYILKNEFFRI